MKKITFSILILFFMVSTIFAGPFGLSEGMSVDEISKISEKGFEPTNPNNDDRYIFVPKKKHELFKIYIAFVDKEKGLYSIRAISEEVKTTGYGKEVQNVFYDMVERLSKVYGKPKIIDKIDPNFGLKTDQYWLFSLEHGARTLSAFWGHGEKGTNLPEEIKDVSIYVKAEYSEGYIIIEYNFSNSLDIFEKQDNVL